MNCKRFLINVNRLINMPHLNTPEAAKCLNSLQDWVHEEAPNFEMLEMLYEMDHAITAASVDDHIDLRNSLITMLMLLLGSADISKEEYNA